MTPVDNKTYNMKQNNKRPVQDFLTFKQALRAAGVSSATLHRAIKGKRLKAYQPNGRRGRLLFTLADIARYLATPKR